ncbi:MFS transporter [Bacillus sp. ISL-40]|uniref:MFS transporter n=1 Tax=unclassified Bacillus (in: firmicutes) TaxID=185979 RepID=UPI001BE6AA5D|nr:MULTISPECIES: MFS transporter [unclassified Bacillus (in: firmicutes)]MBT2698981.1 MFS transporter [Bacillus sp. ISL-40]MBT2742619.1 MFS transporter [Bacillus sp. ISL-77]
MQNNQIKNKKRHMILALLFLGWCLSYLDRMAMNVGIVEIAKEFNLSPSVMGVVLSSFFAGYALMQLPGGWLADKFGSRKVIAMAILFWSLFTVLTGMAWSLMSMIIIRFMFGLGEGGYPAASSKAIADVFPKEERTGAQTIMMSSNSLGGVIAPLIATPLLVWIGWQNLFISIGILGVLVAALLWYYLSPKNMQIEIVDKETVGKASFKDVLKIRTSWQLAIMWFGVSTVVWGLISWMPPYLVDVRGLDLMSMGMLTSIPALAGAVGVIIGGQLIKSFLSGKEKYLAIVSLIIMIVSLYLLFNAPSVSLVITYQAICMFFHGPLVATIFSLPHKIFPKNVIGSTFGMINLGGMIGAFLAPMVMGYLIEVFNGLYVSAFMYIIVCAVLGIFAAAGLNSTNNPSGDAHVVTRNEEII